MSVSTNIYTNISSVNCNPVSFEVLGGQFTTEETPIIFNNGLRLNTHECLKNCQSFTSNNKTSLFLTDLTSAQNILIDSTIPNDIGVLTEIDSPIVTNSLNVHTPLSDSDANVIKLVNVYGSSNNLISAFHMVSELNNTTYSEKDVFRFVFLTSDTLIVESVATKYLLTSLAEGPDNGSLQFLPRINVPPNYANTVGIYNFEFSKNQQVTDATSLYVQEQTFNYSLGPRSISLFQINDGLNIPRYTNAMIKLRPDSKGTSVYGLSTLRFLTSATPFPKEASISFLSYIENQKLENDVKNSFLVKYLVDPAQNNQVVTYDRNIAAEGYSQNYLGIFPFQNYKQTSNGVTYPLAIHGLKNYQTPEYNYSFGTEYVEGQNGVRRIYENIYTGTNQENGLDNVYLGFSSNTLALNFEPDKDTPFYFGPTSDRMPLSSSGLIEDGAIGGEIPFTSDRIYIKLQDYGEKIPDSQQPPSITRYSNTWLCSWLSGDIGSDKKVWMDRYYNPAYYTIDQALSTKLMTYNDKLCATQQYTFDIPSEMYLEPGVLYRYFHTGRQNRLNFINHLSSNSILQITDWTTSPLMDKSPIQNEGIIYNNKPTNLEAEYINLDGSNHVLFPATTDLLSQSELTVSLWVNVPDWANVNGNQVFGNFYNSGFGLINDSSLTTPIITLVDNNTNILYNLNYRFSLLSQIYLTNIDSGFSYSKKIIQRLTDYSYWVFDTASLMGVKLDVNNSVIINTNKNPDTIEKLNSLTQITQIEIDDNENLYIYDNVSKRYIILDTFGNFVPSVNGILGQGTLSNNTNSIQVTTEGKMILCFGEYSSVDNYNNIWEIVGGNLYKNKTIFGNIGQVQQMVFDADNYLWILNGQDTITKIDTKNNSIVFSIRVGKYSTTPPDPCFDYKKQSRYMDFVRVPKDINSKSCDANTNATEDRVILVDLNDKQIYTLSSDGQLLTRLNFIGLTNNQNVNILSDGGFTGYQYLRKFTSAIKRFSWKIALANPNSQNQAVYIFPYDIKNINTGWHMFTFTFNSKTGEINYYLDGIEQPLPENYNFPLSPNTQQIYYKYRTSLLLGCQSIQNTTLNDIIQIDDGYKFVGKVAELRLYNKSLTKGEIEQLYFSSINVADDRTLLWNMQIGERNYIEQIKNWFKFQLPGSKSKYFNINIHNLDVPDNVKRIIEDGIKTNISKIAPANTSLYKLNWL